MASQIRLTTCAVQLERRRYGRATYCWASVVAPNGTLIALGDPWPGINWPRDVLDSLARSALARSAGRLDEAEAATAEAVRAQAHRLAGLDRLAKGHSDVAGRHRS